MKKPIYVVLSLLLFSCQNGHEVDLKVESGFWGHLERLNSTPFSKLYLSDVKNEDIYFVCTPNYFLEKFPGIEDEIKASINIWGHYIGRKIKVSLTKVNLPEPLETQNENEVLEDYYNSCPTGTDLVVGEAYFTDSAIGKTMPKYSYTSENGVKKIVDYKRGLFLKKSSENESRKYEWKTLSQKTGEEFNTQKILETLKQRKLKIVLEEENELLTLRTLVHEFGHVWGLCDQYALGGNSTNCDPNFATINEEGHIILEKDSVMHSSNWVNKIYLTNDDVTGIQKLALRRNNENTWPGQEEIQKIKIEKEAEAKEIEYANIRNITQEGYKTIVTLAIISHASSMEISLEKFDAQNEKWKRIGIFNINESISTNEFNLKLNNHQEIELSKVRLTIKSPNDSITLEKEMKQ